MQLFKSRKMPVAESRGREASASVAVPGGSAGRSQPAKAGKPAPKFVRALAGFSRITAAPLAAGLLVTPLHESIHAGVAHAFGVPVPGITLPTYLGGGVLHNAFPGLFYTPETAWQMHHAALVHVNDVQNMLISGAPEATTLALSGLLFRAGLRMRNPHLFAAGFTLFGHSLGYAALSSGGDYHEVGASLLHLLHSKIPAIAAHPSWEHAAGVAAVFASGYAAYKMTSYAAVACCRIARRIRESKLKALAAKAGGSEQPPKKPRTFFEMLMARRRNSSAG